MANDPFYARRRLREVRSALISNKSLAPSGPAYEAVRSFFQDIARHVANKRREDPEEAFLFLVRTMGELVKQHADAAYAPFGHANPFATNTTRQAPKAPDTPVSTPPVGTPPVVVPPAQPVQQRTRIWKYPIINKPPQAGTGSMPYFAREYSALKMFGYTVGKTEGWSKRRREDFLADFMESDLPAHVAKTFGDEYGAPMSTERLRKIANVIASNASNFFRNDPRRYRAAIEDWESDLGFLHKQYYEGKGMKFMPWPSTRPLREKASCRT